MKSIEKNISQFIEAQFPALYREEGPILIDFIKAYFEWLEDTNNVTYKARRLFDYRDIDSTLDEYVVYFKNKYAKDIPLEIKANKKLFIKNIQDLYKSKGSERSFEIFFRTLYNKDVKIYYPGDDILRVSDGDWFEGKYIEITSFVPNIQDYIGRKIIGVNSGAEAAVENYFQRIANRKVVDVLQITNLNGIFDYKEPIKLSTANTIVGVSLPSTVGSLSAVGLIDGGANFDVGDILDIDGKGDKGKAKVTAVTQLLGKVNFNLIQGGSGYSLNALSTVFPQVQLEYASNTGNLQVDQLIYTTNTSGSMIANGIITAVNSSVVTLKQFTSGFATGNNFYTALKVIVEPSSGSFTNGEFVFQANSTSNVAVGVIVGIVPNIGNTAYFIGNVTGSFVQSVYANTGNTFVLTGNSSSAQGFIYEIGGGSNTGSASVANVVGGGSDATFRVGDILDKEILTINTDNIRDNLKTKLILFNESSNAIGTVSVTSGANTVIGVGTAFTTTFVVGDYIQVSNTTAKHIKEITLISNNTQLQVSNNFANTQATVPYYADISNYSFEKQVSAGGERIGTILANALTYVELEVGTIAYLAGINPGTGYSLDPYASVTESIVAALEEPGVGGRYKGADAIVLADAGIANGIAIGVGIIDSGIGYEPGERVSLTKPDSPFQITGTAIVKTSGIQEGYWRSTRGFLDSDKFIQDSKYYQEYSYEVQTPVNFEDYKDVVKSLIHTAGTELFGKFSIIDDSIPTPVEFGESRIVQA